MKLRPFSNLGRALAVCLLAALNASAQEPAETLSLRLVYYEGAAPVYLDVGDKGVGLLGSAGSLRRLNAAPPAQSGERFTGLDINVGRRGEGVVFWVRLSREIDESVATIYLGEYEVGVGEERRVEALEQYGFEPMRVSVVRGAPFKLTPPPVVNLTRSIEVLGVEVSEGKPQLEVTLKNASDRSIKAVTLRVMKGSEVRGTRPDSHRDGKPWALPGGVWTAKLNVVAGADRTSAEGHRSEQPDEIVIASVLFSDGGYEGEVAFAIGQAGYGFGSRIQAGRALPLLRACEEREAEGLSMADAAKEFRRMASALSQTADDAQVDEFIARHPAFPARERAKMKEAIEAGLKDVRRGLVSDLKPVADGHPQATRGWFRYWLGFVRESYERLLSMN